MTQPDNNTPLVSIIIPAYNTAQYVYRAIESSLRQTHPNIEVLVIDDGSTDDTLRVAQSYMEKDKRVRVFHQENAGVSAARNHGIREALGDYFMFLDSDDWLDDNCAEVLLSAQLKNPGKLIASGRWLAYFVEGGRIFRVRDKHKMTPQIVEGSEEAIMRCWKGANCQSACYKIFSAEIIRERGVRFREGIHSHEDGLFVSEYLHCAGGLVYIDEVVWVVLARPGSATDSGCSPKMIQSTIEADKIMMDYPLNSPELREFCCAYHAVSSMPFLVIAIKSGLPEEIAFMRNHLRGYVRQVFRSKHFSLVRKMKFAAAMYLSPFLCNVGDKIRSVLRKFSPKDPGQPVEE